MRRICIHICSEQIPNVGTAVSAMRAIEVAPMVVFPDTEGLLLIQNSR